VQGGGCSSNKDDNVFDRQNRLRQLLLAAAEYEPGDLVGASGSFDEDAGQVLGGAEGQQGVWVDPPPPPPYGRPGEAAAAGAAAAAGGGASPEARAYNLAVARNFLDEVALYSGVEDGVAGRGVRLMTMHAAKGLEFEAVFVAGEAVAFSC
jgi:superfamily I DNA/RNA helicase